MADDYDSGGRKGLFNAAAASTERLDALQRAINAARFNLLAINMETGTWNYEVMINALNGLAEEGKPKFTEAEKAKADKIRDLVDLQLKHNPPVFNTNDGWKVNPKNNEALVKLLRFYETKLREFLDSHNLNNPDSDDDEGL